MTHSRTLCRMLTLVTFLLSAMSSRLEAVERAMGRQSSRPNIIVIFVDNFGNGDLGCFGSKLHRTPHVDRMAAEGMKFTSFYVASGVCTPSRASLMTGCYPRRVNMHVGDKNTPVLQPVAAKGLHPDETTIAELLKAAGYATACIGKWHLGDQPEFLPTRQGFDEFFGLPYSDDMTRDKRPDVWPELPLMRGERVIEAPANRNLLVQRCTEEAVAFIERHREEPFFLYLPHTMPGSTPHPFSSPAFRGKSRNGVYGDAVEELDWSTGQILGTLKRLGIDRRTLVVWTSDNGAVQRNPPQGSCAPYRGFGYDTSEGAMRMPCVMRWPGQIPAEQVCDELCSTLDLLPTFAGLSGADHPERPIDGRDIAPLLMGKPHAKSPHDETGFFYYQMDQLQAVRSGPWKLYLPLEKKYVSLLRKTAAVPPQLFDVRNDVSETREVSGEHPDVVRRLLALAESARKELDDEDRPGSGQRPAGQVAQPMPLTKPPINQPKSPPTVQSAKPRPTNLVFILTDNQGAWTLGCYGNPDIRTPHIDRLASDGMRFTRALSSNPVCSPTRATFLTGLLPSQHGVHSFLDPKFMMGPEAYNTLDEFTSLGEVLRDAGYICGLSGKWHLGANLTASEGFSPKFWTTKPDGSTTEFYDQPIIEGGEVRKEAGYTTDLWTRRGVEFLEKNRDRPFFLLLAYNGPYSLGPLMQNEARNRHADFYADKQLLSFPRDAMHPWQLHNKQFHNSLTAMRRVAAETSGVDDGVGEIMATLKRLSLDDNTLVVYAADQGWMGGQNGLWGMGDHTHPVGAHELMMQIPLIFRQPGRIPAGTTSDIIVSNYDFLPTVLSHLGLSDRMPNGGPTKGWSRSPGRDFSQVLRSEPLEWDNVMFYEMETCRAIRTDQWKLVLRHPSGPHELYDLRTDPRERFNLFGQPGVEPTRADLEKRLTAFFTQHADPQYDLWRNGRSKAKRVTEE